VNSSLVHWVLHGLRLREASTQTTAAERQCLARHATGRGTIVELGVMHGVTTRLLSEVAAPEGRCSRWTRFRPGG
jgi:hypothetical protein